MATASFDDTLTDKSNAINIFSRKSVSEFAILLAARLISSVCQQSMCARMDCGSACKLLGVT